MSSVKPKVSYCRYMHSSATLDQHDVEIFHFHIFFLGGGGEGGRCG